MSYDFLGKGLKYPFRFQSVSGGTEVSAATSREHDHIRESILQILGRRPGERLMNPEFGSRLHDLVFEQNDEVLKGLIRHYVIDAIKRWEKRVVITGVTFDDAPQNIDRNLLPVRISYRVIQSQVEGSMVYPFYREMGEALR
jgi:phage baseplate assembly protein W